MSPSLQNGGASACSAAAEFSNASAFRFQLALAIAIGILVCLIGSAAAGLLLASAAFAAFFIFGPSRFSLTFFLLYMLASHQYISPFIIPFAGVEWHPREILLGLLLAHWTVKAAQGKARFTFDPAHAAILLLALSFAFMAFAGAALGNAPRELIQECRFPVFLLCYPVFISLVNTEAGLRFYGKILAAVMAAIALASVTFSMYATAAQTILQLNQTAFGEFMPLLIGSSLVQSVRPNGHLFFEVFLVLCASAALAKGVPTRHKALAALGGLLFAAAILVTAMRTAYASALLALAILLILMLPSRRAQFITVSFVALLALFVSAWFAHPLRDAVSGLLVRDVSLQGRLVEIRGALHAVSARPITGNGLGSSFEGLGLAQSGQQLAAGRAVYHSLHNVWLYYLLKGGLIGFALAATGLGTLFVRGYLLLPSLLTKPLAHALTRGLLAAYAGQLIASLTMPRLIYPSGYVLVGMMAWVICSVASWLRMNGQKASSEEMVDSHLTVQ